MGFIAYSFARMEIDAKEFGLWMATTSVGYIFGNLANKHLLRQYQMTIITLLGAFFSLASLVVMEVWFTASPNSPEALAIPMLLLGFSNGVIIANSIIIAASSIPRLRGSATGLVGAMQMGAGGVSGTIAIFLGADKDTSTGILTLIIISFCSLVSSIWSAQIERKNEN